jgi:type I restriction enzyme S subunit
MIIWPTSPRRHASFFYYHFQPLFHYERGLIPDHMQASFRIEDLYGYQIAVPPEDEQLAIHRALAAETAKLDTLTAEAERAIELLQERRTALISAAVTGKIDVRNFAPTEAA